MQGYAAHALHAHPHTALQVEEKEGAHENSCNVG
jgi:hypothetical protein